MVMLLDCKPEIVSADGNQVTLRFRDKEERQAFERAVAEAKMSPDEHVARHARKFGLPPYGDPIILTE